MVYFNHKTFIRYVNARRLVRDWTWKDVSTATGIGRSNLSRSSKHTRHLTVEEVLTLADEFDANIKAFTTTQKE